MLYYMKSSVFWDVSPYSPLKVNLWFSGTCCFHLQGQRIGQSKNHHEIGSKQSYLAVCFMLVSHLPFPNPKVGGDMFLQKMSWLSEDYMVLYQRRLDPSHTLSFELHFEFCMDMTMMLLMVGNSKVQKGNRPMVPCYSYQISWKSVSWLKV